MNSEYSNSEPMKLSKSLYTILCHKIIIFMIVLLVMDEVYLDVAFVHPFQEFLIKLVMASGKFILDIN